MEVAVFVLDFLLRWPLSGFSTIFFFSEYAISGVYGQMCEYKRGSRSNAVDSARLRFFL